MGIGFPFRKSASLMYAVRQSHCVERRSSADLALVTLAANLLARPSILDKMVRPIHPKGNWPVEYAGYILVEDASGCRFQLHQYRRRRWFSHQTRFALDTGESVHKIDEDSFVITKTGEALVRVT